MGPVVVGTDASGGSRRALAWAVEEAGRRQAPLRVVHALPWPVFSPERRVGAVLPTGLQEAAQQVADEAAAHVRTLAPQVEVSVRVHHELPPAAALVHESADAQLLVVGQRDRGGLSGHALGSTSVSVAAHAPCPVVVARGGPDGATAGDTGPVVVGVDGSEQSERAVEFAFAEAELRGAPLTAVHVWSRVWTSSRTPLPMLDWSTVAEEERAQLVRSLSGVREKFPGVVVREHLVEGHPGGALVEESAGAQLLVVGPRGRGGFLGLLLGSVSQAVLNHAQCPVAVVRRSQSPGSAESAG